MHAAGIMVHRAERSRLGAQERLPMFLAGDRPMLTRCCLQSHTAMWAPLDTREDDAVMWTFGRSPSGLYAIMSTLADQAMYI